MSPRSCSHDVSPDKAGRPRQPQGLTTSRPSKRRKSFTPRRTVSPRKLPQPMLRHRGSPCRFAPCGVQRPLEAPDHRREIHSHRSRHDRATPGLVPPPDESTYGARPPRSAMGTAADEKSPSFRVHYSEKRPWRHHAPAATQNLSRSSPLRRGDDARAPHLPSPGTAEPG